MTISSPTAPFRARALRMSTTLRTIGQWLAGATVVFAAVMLLLAFNEIGQTSDGYTEVDRAVSTSTAMVEFATAS